MERTIQTQRSGRSARRRRPMGSSVRGSRSGSRDRGRGEKVQRDDKAGSAARGLHAADRRTCFDPHPRSGNCAAAPKNEARAAARASAPVAAWPVCGIAPPAQPIVTIDGPSRIWGPSDRARCLHWHCVDVALAVATPARSVRTWPVRARRCQDGLTFHCCLRSQDAVTRWRDLHHFAIDDWNPDVGPIWTRWARCEQLTESVKQRNNSKAKRPGGVYNGSTVIIQWGATAAWDIRIVTEGRGRVLGGYNKVSSK